MALSKFNAVVKSASGETQTLAREADSREGLITILRAEGWMPVKVEEISGKTSLNLPAFVHSNGPRKPSRKDIQAFMSNFATLLRAGMDIERCLRTLERESREPLQGILNRITDRVRQGESLSEAMAKSEVFSPFHIRIIRAGEFSGNLHLALTRIASVIEREAEIRGRIRNAIAYPLFLVCFGILSFCGILLFILPKFTTVYKEMGSSKLPFTTSVLLDISSLLRTHAFWLLPLIVVGLYMLFRYAFQFRNNPAADRFRMRLPVIGRAVREIHTAALLRNLGLLLQSGLPITQALSICAKISDSAIFAQAVTNIEKGVQEGARISVEMRRQDLFSETVLNLVSVGEESGRLDALLLETSEDMEKKMDQIVKGAVALLEPVLILAVGILIGLMVVATLLPIFSLSSAGFKR